MNYVRFFDAGKTQNLIYLPKRIKIVKGGNTLLKTKLYGIKFAAEKLTGKWDFWVHLSESDGILRDIEPFLKFYRGYNFVPMDPCWQAHCSRPLGVSC